MKLSLALLFVSLSTLAEEPFQAALKRWQQMRFGMFIHWGPVSLTGHEIGWSRGQQTPIERYDNLYKEFNPTKFNADEWACIARAAGMKYLVLTTKHHDGFCLWNTKYTDYNIMNTPFRRDVTRELADACRKHGIMFCAYYSIADWYHPDYPMGSPRGRTKKPNPNMDRYFLFMKNQLTELLTNYGPLGVLWFDGEWGEAWTTERGIELYEYLKQLQPSLIINNRISKARKGIEGVSTPGQFAGDFDTPEQRIGAFQMQRPWETCMTLGTQWAWKPDDKIKSLTECLQALVRTAGGDGNFLFNVGPMPTGEIEPRQAERLKEMGAWLAKHGNAIYGTRGGPYKPARHVVSTRKDNKVFLHILAWPEQTLTLPALPAKLLRASPGVQQTDAGLAITVPAEKRDPIDTIITLELDRPAIELEPISIAPHQ